MSEILARLSMCLLIAFISLSAMAHEIGTTQVRLALHHDGTWSALITTGPQSLLNKLEAAERLPLSDGLNADSLRAAISRQATTIARHVDVRFDGAASSAKVSIQQLELPADITLPSFVVLRMSGSRPPDAQHVTWRFGLVYSTYAVVFSGDETDGTSTQWLDGGATSRPFPLVGTVKPQTLGEIVWQYLSLGFLHIIPEGLDHILFVFGLFLLTTRLRPILVQVTAFTVAHSVTLGLTMYGVVSLPSRVVEPLIALSVAYVAIENIMTSKFTPWRPVIVFGFGLLHGMGFAGALTDLRLARSEILPALVSFNVGIELAQLAAIAAAYCAVAAWHRDKPWYRTHFVIPASAVIAATGLFWTAQRIVES